MRFLLLLLLIIPGLSRSQDASAIVQFDGLSKNLGIIKKGDKIEDVFTFTNISKENVHIDIVSTCECTAAKWTKGIIKPGEEGEIRFVFDSSKKEEETPVDIDVYFLNTDPNTGNPYSVFLTYTYAYIE